MTTDATISATLDAAAALTRALDAARIIPNPEAVHAAGDRLRAVTDATDLMLIGTALADTADLRVADTTLDVSAADTRYEALLDRLAVMGKAEAGKLLNAQLDRPDLASLPDDEHDRLAAIADWIDARDDDAPPPAA